MTTPTPHANERPADPLQAAYAVADAFSKWQSEPDVAPNESLLNALHDLCDALPGWPDGARPQSVPEAPAVDSQWLINRCDKAVQNAAAPGIPNFVRATHLITTLRMIRSQAKASLASFPAPAPRSEP